MSQRTLFETHDRRHLIVNARHSIELSFSFFFFSFLFWLIFDHVPLRQSNLSAFFDSGHGFANFLLTFLDHTRCGTRIPRKQITTHRSSIKLNEIFEISRRNTRVPTIVYSRVTWPIYVLKNCYKHPRPFCHRLCVTNRILLMWMNVKSMGFPVVVNSVKTFIWKISTFTSVST